MLEIFLTFMAILSSIWYIKSWFHPKDFPPGPRFPFPIIGDLYLVGSDFVKGLKKLKEKFGPTFGFWLGTQRCVVVTDFELLQDVMNRSETSSRQKLPSAGIYFLPEHEWAPLFWAAFRAALFFLASARWAPLNFSKKSARWAPFTKIGERECKTRSFLFHFAC